MKTIKYFAELGWHTVPLKGELKRKKDGTKTLPAFEKKWRDKYQDQVNRKYTALGGAITGECSNIIAIDCDNDATYSLFRSLDPDYNFVFVSNGKLDSEGNVKVCGTIIYKYNEELPNNFSIADNSFALDFYSNRGFVYLPTDANTTKLAWPDKPEIELKEVPENVLLLLRRLKETTVSVNSATAKVTPSVYNCLNPLVSKFTETGAFMPGLFKIITPKDFRDSPEYTKHNYLHPNDVPEGRGSEYLSKVSAILGADVSIPVELYVEAMHAINNLWDNPLDPSRLDATILDPMVEGSAAVDGESIWAYDKDWKDQRCLLQSKRQTTFELGFDDITNEYYCIDQINERFKRFGKDTELMSYIEAAAWEVPKKATLKATLPLISATSQPNKPFGFIESKDPAIRRFNTFVQTPELAILANPEPYAASYKYPETTLNYFNSLIPDKEMCEFVLKFLRRKLTTFEYSPVILYFLGVHGSGKDTFVELLEHMVKNVAKPTTKEFLEIYNSYMLDSYFVHLDEYGNQLTKRTDKEEALGKIKAYSGKSKISVRQMRTDGHEVSHRVTFIMTANKNPLMIEDGDRRIAFCNTPNVLALESWVNKFGGMSAVHEQIMSETKDFAYYLATEVEEMTRDEYMLPPAGDDKLEMIADSMYAAERIAFAFKHSMYDYLIRLANKYSCIDLVKQIQHRYVTTEDLENLYDELTDYNGDLRTLTKALRNKDIELIPTTKKGEKVYKLSLPEEQFPED